MFTILSIFALFNLNNTPYDNVQYGTNSTFTSCKENNIDVEELFNKTSIPLKPISEHHYFLSGSLVKYIIVEQDSLLTHDAASGLCVMLV